MKTILILASNPYGDLRIDREIRDLTAVIERSKNAKEFAVVDKLAVRPSDLQEIFAQNNPYVVHFSGHGAGEEGLVFESDQSGEQLVSNQALSGLFNLFGQDVECVLLNACTTEIQADAIGEHVPYVIGTSQKILDRAAYFFAVGFYRGLGNSESIEVSVDWGCNAVQLQLPDVQIVSDISDTFRKAKVVKTIKSSIAAEPLKIILKRNSRLNNPDLSANIPPEFRKAIREEGKRKDYYDKLREVLERFGQTTIEREKPISKFEYEQRQTFLNKVQEFWIEGFLKPSLYFNRATDRDTDAPSGEILRPLTNLEVIPIDIDESYDELQQTDIMGQIGHGKTLLILGDPGSGKTIALLQLAERLIKITQQDMTKPIPVVFNLSSWGQKQQPLEEYLIEELKDQYQVPKTWSEPWIKDQQMILLLDGLDEVKENHRKACVIAINKFIATHLETEIAVCSRVKDYEALGETLLLSSAICIQPLSKKQLLEFLENTDDSLLGLKTVIERDQEIAEFAQTPLILNMMTWTYHGWSAEECRKQFRIAKNRLSNLFESYIEKNLDRENKEKKYPNDKVLHWLRWLATKMVNESKIIFLIEKMQPTLLRSRSERRVYRIWNFVLGGLSVGLSGGLIVGLSGGLSEVGTILGSIFGLMVGLIGAVIAGKSKEINLFEQMSWSWQSVKSRIIREVSGGVMGGLSVGLSFGLPSGVMLALFFGIFGIAMKKWEVLMGGLFFGLMVALSAGLMGGLIGGLIGGLNSGLSSTEVEKRTFPNQGIWSSSKNSVRIGLSFGLLIVLMVGLVYFRLWNTLNWPKIELLSETERVEILTEILRNWVSLVLSVGLIGGFLVGLRYGGTTCIQHFNLRRILYRKGRIPWNYARFLDYTSERLLMKKVGGGYIFYHRMLMEHFDRRNQVS